MKLWRALVVGGSGQVGGALMEVLLDLQVTATQRDSATSPQLDLLAAARSAALAQAVVDGSRPQAVFIAAGMTSVERCEDEPGEAMAANRDGAAALARAACRAGARTVYYSSDYVFDGTAGPYDEEDDTHPLCVYGATKLAGEHAVVEEDADALILRTTVVYGPEAAGKNFAYQLAARLGRGEPMMVPDDQISSPTYNRDLALASRLLVEQEVTGICHVAGGEIMDRATLAVRLARAADLNPVGLRPVPSTALGQRAPRPLACGLRIGRLLGLAAMFHPRSVEEAVAHWRTHPRGLAWPRQV